MTFPTDRGIKACHHHPITITPPTPQWSSSSSSSWTSPRLGYGKSSLPLPSPEPWVNRIFLVLALLVCKRTPLNRCTGKDALYKSRQNEATNMSWPIKKTSHHGWHLLVNSHQHLAVAIHLWGWLTVDQPATNSWLVTETHSMVQNWGNSGPPLRLELLPIQNSNSPVESGILNSGVLLDFSMKLTKFCQEFPKFCQDCWAIPIWNPTTDDLGRSPINGWRLL